MKLSIGVACLAASAALLSQAAQAQCITGGAGGAIPTSGTGDGTWPTTPPTSPFSSTLAVTVPSGATVINAVKLNGLSHTWIGDTQIFLESPSGLKYNLAHRPGSAGGTLGDDGDYLGDYVIVDPLQFVPCGVGAGQIATTGGILASGTYIQNFGDWPAGTLGIDNTPLESIPVASGNWTLWAYDWVGGDTGGLTSWELCFGSPTPPPPPPSNNFNCITGGAGGAWPASGGTDGTWPTTLPTGELASTMAVTVPGGSTRIVAVKLNGLAHTWSGDNQIVLETPSGAKINLFQDTDGVFGGGCADAFSGDYVFVDANVGQSQCGGPALTFGCAGGNVAPGTYYQYFGAWPTGSAGIDNTPLESAPIASGNYTLRIYDWYVGADDGVLANWELCFDGVSGPVAYCTSGTSSNGCNPSISAAAQPSATLATACVLNVAGVDGQKNSLIFYGVNNAGFTPQQWGIGSTSFLCVKAPTQRMNSQNTGGTPGQCNGSVTQSWNGYLGANPNALGAPFSAGQKVYAQAWYRDPAAVKTTNLSDALELTVVP
ncbi:MAG: hypothetical protein IT454_01965 [Planctomycetes bacterium]|nr:hypothetical protein [Planctomycetota bacterium]